MSESVPAHTAEGRRSEEKINAYDQGPYHWFLPFFYALEHERPLKLLAPHIKATDRVLDLGCGDGRHSALLSGMVRTVVGLDNQMLPLQFAHLLIHGDKISPSAKRGNVQLCRGDGTRLPFGSGTFDVAVCFDMIEHLPPQRVPSFIEEVWRVLQPAGLFVVVTPNRASLHNRLWGHRLSEKHYYEYTLHELSTIIGEHRFSVEYRAGIYLPPPILRPYLEHYANVFPIKHIFRLLINAGAGLPEWSEKLFLIVRRLAQ
jgi:SAM-dependent methyltransferase